MKKDFKLIEKVCLICSSTYLTKYRNSMYCSTKCKGAAQLKNNPNRKAQVKKWQQEHRDSMREHAKTYYAKNKGYYKSKAVGREHDVLRATPKWVNKTDIVNIYENTPAGHHVDHIIPINGSNVSGLHVPWNLQYLPALDNIRKSNKV